MKEISKPIKAISWIERVKSALHVYIPNILRPAPTRVLCSSQVLDEKIGRLVKKTQFSPFSNKLSKYKVSDFSIENLQAVGVLDSMKSVTLTASQFSKINSVEKAMENIVSKHTINNNQKTN